MSKLATPILLVFLTLVGLVALYAAVNAASVPFAIHMAVMALWAAAFLFFVSRRAKQG
jgi:hypothetical protein